MQIVDKKAKIVKFSFVQRAFLRISIYQTQLVMGIGQTEIMRRRNRVTMMRMVF